jgi:predicted ester cyclase
MSSPSENKQFVAEYFHALSGRSKSPDVVARFVSDRALAEHIEQAEAGFPSYEIVVDEVTAERDLVAVRGTFRGVHRGAFAGIAPTGRQVSAGLMIMYRIAGNRIVEHWMQFDASSVMAQLTEGQAAAQLTHHT